ncbi:MAG: response regulator transcription factor [Fluviicola sp.]|jgi:DNA-binding NarL/FixJ family response regulator|nr:response regulator transcription factor [Fluviicola sp.]
MPENIKVLIVDDHKLIVEAWTNILNTVSNFAVCGCADNAEDALFLAHRHRPDIILMDINLKGSSGFEATESIINQLPKTKVIALSIHDDLSIVKKIFTIGATGYLTKNSSKKELIESIQKVFDGEKYICEEIKERFLASAMNGNDENAKKELTSKEIEIVKFITKGLTSKEIGEMLNISNRTVDTHRHNILKKLDIPNAAQLSSWAKEKGYV